MPLISNATWETLRNSADSWAVDSSTLINTFTTWSNVSQFSEKQLLDYAEKYYTMYVYINSLYWYEIVLLAFLSCMGIVGFIAEAIVLRHNDFKTPSFLYHKSIVAFEMFFCIGLLIESSIDFDYNYYNDPVRNVVADTMAGIENVCGMTVEWLALVVCFERLTAIFVPSKFEKINRNRVAKAAIFICFLIGFVHYCTRPFDSILQTSDWYLNFRQYIFNFQMIECFSLSFASFFLVIGIVRQLQLSAKKQLNGDAKAAASLSLQISLLSLSVAIPPFIETLLYQISQSVCYNSACIRGTNAVKGSYDAAISGIHTYTMAKSFGFASYIWWGIAHSDHFYVYAILSPKFREAVKRQLGIQTNTVEQISVMATSK